MALGRSSTPLPRPPPPLHPRPQLTPPLPAPPLLPRSPLLRLAASALATEAAAAATAADAAAVDASTAGPPAGEAVLGGYFGKGDRLGGVRPSRGGPPQPGSGAHPPPRADLMVKLDRRAVGEDVRGPLPKPGRALDRHGEPGALGAYLFCRLHPPVRKRLRRQRRRSPSPQTGLSGMWTRRRDIDSSSVSGRSSSSGFGC